MDDLGRKRLEAFQEQKNAALMARFFPEVGDTCCTDCGAEVLPTRFLRHAQWHDRLNDAIDDRAPWGHEH